MVKKVVSRLKRRQPIFLREWREHRGLTLKQLGEAIGKSHASLSRIETGEQPYSQGILEAAAERLNTDVASLLMRNPTDSDAIWSLWERAKPGERRMIVDIAKTIVEIGGGRKQRLKA